MGTKVFHCTMAAAALGLVFVVRPALGQPTVADGFTIEEFACVPNPIAI